MTTCTTCGESASVREVGLDYDGYVDDDNLCRECYRADLLDIQAGPDFTDLPLVNTATK